MKHLFFLFFVTCFSLHTIGKDITITGHVNDLKAGKIHLSIQQGSDLTAVDSTFLDAKGDFKILLKEGYKQGVYKLRLEVYKPATIIIGKEETVTITADLAGMKEGVIRIVSSKENDAYAVLTNFFKIHSSETDSIQDLLDEIQRFDPQYEAKKAQVKKAYANAVMRYNNSVRLVPGMFSGTFTAEVLCPLYLVAERNELEAGKKYDTDEAFQHAHFFNYVDFSDPRIINTSTYEMKLFTYLDKYVEHNVDGFKAGVDNVMTGAVKNEKVRDFTISWLLKIFTTKGPSQLVEYVHDQYSQGCEIPLNPETEKLLGKLKQVGTGAPAPELSIKDINYTPQSMKATLKGKVGMIYFWASSCAHCMEYTPKVFELYKKYKSKGFEVYAVSLDNDYPAWLKAIQEMKLEWMNVSDLNGWDSEVIRTYAVERTPSVFLVDKEGNILDKNFSPDMLESKLKKYLP